MKNIYSKSMMIAVLLLLLGVHAFASRWDWGVLAGVVRSESVFSADIPYAAVGPLNAFSLGVFSSYLFIADQLGIQPEIHYTVEGFDILEEDLGEKISSKYNISYLKIPVLVSYRFPLKGRIRPGLVFGPYWGIAHKVSEVQTAYGNKEKRELEDNLKNSDVGLVLGGNVRHRLGALDILLSVRYYFGLSNISKNIQEVAYDFQEDDTIKNRAFSISLGIALIPRASR